MGSTSQIIWILATHPIHILETLLNLNVFWSGSCSYFMGQMIWLYQVGTWLRVLIRMVSRADNTYSYCKWPWTHLHLVPFCTHSVSQALEETRTNCTRNFNHHKQTTIIYTYHVILHLVLITWPPANQISHDCGLDHLMHSEVWIKYLMHSNRASHDHWRIKWVDIVNTVGLIKP